MEMFLTLVMLSLLSGHVSPPDDDIQREGFICPTYQFNNLSIPSTSHTGDIGHVKVTWMPSSKAMWNVIGWSRGISAECSRLTVDVIKKGYEFLGRSLSVIHFALNNLSWENCHHIFTFLLMFCGVLYSFYLFANLSYVLGSATLEFFITPEQVSEPERDTTPVQVEVYKPKPKPKQEQMPKKKRKKHPKRKNNNKKR